MARNTNPNAINTAEPRPTMILRLLTEAQAGKVCGAELWRSVGPIGTAQSLRAFAAAHGVELPEA